MEAIPAVILFYMGAIPELSKLGAEDMKFVAKFTVIVLGIFLVLVYFMLRWAYGSLAEKQFVAYQKKHGSISDVFE